MVKGINPDQLTFAPVFSCGKTSPARSHQRAARTSGVSCRRSAELWKAAYLSLDLRPGNGNLLGPYWELVTPSRGGYWTRNTGASPKDAVESSLLPILEATPHQKYYLSKTACKGILRRVKEKNKTLPDELEKALTYQAENGYLPEGNCLPQHLALYENHGIASRYRGPLEVCPTLSAACGEGGNNLPLVLQKSVYVKQSLTQYKRSGITSTQCANQRKNFTDLVCEKYSHNGSSFVRRLTPLECERLQGFPDHWTSVEGGADTKKYMALGNSVAIPCVEYVLCGISCAWKGAG